MKSLLIVTTILFVTVLLPQKSSARLFEKCELAHELLRQGFDWNALPDWICLIFSESSFRTDVIGGPNTDNSYDYGLFQINNNYWCDWGGVANECNIECRYFLDDDITDDVQCVRKIYDIHGYWGWYGWVNQCQNGLPDLSECF